jgi:hypothetical protein
MQTLRTAIEAALSKSVAATTYLPLAPTDIHKSDRRLDALRRAVIGYLGGIASDHLSPR